MTVTADQFDDYFKELHDTTPFPWQQRLAAQVCKGTWPEFIDLPTASGKTACIDIAIFALAVQAARPPEERTVSRRIFFVVNRRVIVDEAHERASRIRKELIKAEQGTVLHDVAEALRKISGDEGAPPLDVSLLRGGVVRDNRWARSITQPTVITSTVDQVGSRLLFCGYGVRDEAAPLHAALVAHDSTILLDEAHISRPFVETLQAIRTYRGENWAEQPICTPFHFVQMTATHDAASGNVLQLDEEDRANPELRKRHDSSKPIRLEVAKKAKGKKAIAELAAAVVKEAVSLQTDKRRNIAIVVNRVATAREAHRLLRERFAASEGQQPAADVELAIGRMRPYDRDLLTQRIQNRVGNRPLNASGEVNDNASGSRPLFVVATQCLEVGADFDFDAMVSECASLDALRQRFGRLNRTGNHDDPAGAVIIRADQVLPESKLEAQEKKGTVADPIYGNALARTWNWLQEVANDGVVDFGVNAMDALAAEHDVMRLRPAPLHAPVMFPAYVDLWAQTSPRPEPTPNVSLFLHGPHRGEPDVNVCWRSDLPEKQPGTWQDIVSLCPPTSIECMPVPIGLVRRWLENEATSDDERSDLLDATTVENDSDSRATSRPALLWRGTEKSELYSRPSDLRPGDTVVLPASCESRDVFGHIPDGTPADIAEQAYRKARGRAVLRLWPGRFEAWPNDEPVKELKEWIADPDLVPRMSDQQDLLTQAAEFAPDTDAWIADSMRLLAHTKYRLDRDPGGRVVVLKTRDRVPDQPQDSNDETGLMDDGDDDASATNRAERVCLADHTRHVVGVLKKNLSALPLDEFSDEFVTAAELHDAGKADDRFQALLINGDPADVGAQPQLWAKSGEMPDSRAARRLARERSRLPDDFRHEMLSVQLVERLPDLLSDNPIRRDLVLHLIGAHHGHGRPFAPVVTDNAPVDVELELSGRSLQLGADERRSRPPHRIDSGIADRFWRLTRRYGWWGLAYLEAVLRMADQQASAGEDTGRFTRDETCEHAEAVR